MASGANEKAVDQKTPNAYRKKEQKHISDISFLNSPSPNRKIGLNSKISFSHFSSASQTQKTKLHSTALRRTEIMNQFHSSILNTVALNVGGNIFVTTKQTLSRENSSILSDIEKQGFSRDSKNRIFIDRDGDLFENVLKYLETGALHLPKTFSELNWLRGEAKYYKLTKLSALIDKCVNNSNSKRSAGNYITLTTHANYKIHCRDQNETAFHRIASITVSGHVQSCKMVFGNHLSMDRDSNIEQDRYSCRMMLKNLSLPSAFEVLQKHNFALKTSETMGAQGHVNVNNSCTEQEKWIHTTLYVFMKNEP